MKRCIPVIAFTFFAFFTACAQEPVYAIKNVNVITMTATNEVIENATVVIENRKISAIRIAGELQVMKTWKNSSVITS